MKKFIGFCFGLIGAKLYQTGGWTGEEEYEDLNLFGKIGYRMFVKGFELMGITHDDIEIIMGQPLKLNYK